eukprot:Nk52_evm125s226 gene=Nk52_evmTU125s226
MSGMSQVPRRPLIIGVAGGTASGKNTVCEVIRKQLFAEQRGGDEMLKIEIIHMDSFYKNLTKAEEENIEDYNFDHPDAFDFNTIVSTLTALKAQKKIIIPDYDFKNHRRLDCGNEVSNVDVVLLEGILVLYQKDLRDLLDLMLFVDIDADTRLARRAFAFGPSVNETVLSHAPSFAEQGENEAGRFALQVAERVSVVQSILKEAIIDGGCFALRTALFGIGHFRVYEEKKDLQINVTHTFDNGNSVKIFFDKFDIPHIEGNSLTDVSFAQGFVHARDRLWQMESMRRLAQGQMSEMLGEAALIVDKYALTYGWGRLAKKDLKQLREDPSQKGILEVCQSYTDGVNEFLSADGYKQTPVEFTLLRHTPEKWTLLDTLSIMRFLTWQMSRGNYHELTRAFMGKRLGKEYEMFDVERHFHALAMHLPKGVEVNFITDLKAGLEAPKTEGFAGSNGWVVSGKFTKSGKPILANDPHLPLSSPSIWHQIHLTTEENNVAGVSIPGMPGVMIGHNDHIAWGVTLSFVDMADFFLEKISEDNKTYEFMGEKRDLTVHVDEIKVKGGTVVRHTSYETHHGPIVSDVEGIEERLALQNAAFILPSPTAGFLGFNKAKNWKDFCEALEDFRSLSLNIVYADKEGNIGYHTTGTPPVRHAESKRGTLVSEGWTGKNEWISWVPVKEMPKTLNPEQGYVVTANHRIVDPEYKHFLGECFLTNFRASRIEELIKQFITKSIKFSMEDMIKIQLDVKEVVGERMVRKVFSSIVEDKDADVNKALTMLKNWDFQVSADSTTALIYQEFIHCALHVLLSPQFKRTGGTDMDEDVLAFRGALPKPLLVVGSELIGRESGSVLKMLSEADHPFVKEAGGVKTVVKQALKMTVERLKKENGPDFTKWTWGKYHQAQLVHSLGHKGPLAKVFNYGPFPIDGNEHTVLHTSSHLLKKHLALGFLPSMRTIVDFSDLEKAVMVILPGQSGNPASKHYDDMFSLYMSGRDYPLMHFSRETVRQNAVHSLVLKSKRMK